MRRPWLTVSLGLLANVLVGWSALGGEPPRDRHPFMAQRHVGRPSDARRTAVWHGPRNPALAEPARRDANPRMAFRPDPRARPLETNRVLDQKPALREEHPLPNDGRHAVEDHHLPGYSFRDDRRPGDYHPIGKPSLDSNRPSADYRSPEHRLGMQRASPLTVRTTGPYAARIVRQGFFMPLPAERRFIQNEVVVYMPSGLTSDALDALAARHHLTRLGSQSFGVTGQSLYRWRVDDGRPVDQVIEDLQSEDHVTAAQPNFTYKLQEGADGVGATEGDPAQYAVEKLQLPEAHLLATGDHVLVAVIDSAIDGAQPELKGVIAGSFDAVGGEVSPHPHGTAMAGAIAAHGKLIGVAPQVKLLAIRAFGDASTGAEATTFNIIRGLDWAVAHSARVVNMSFAGPADPVLQDAIAKARAKGLILVAAAGNAGPKSPPLYPASDPNVIAVTATDAADKLFPQANRGSYIAVAAPGVDILVPAPNGRVQLTSGTSVAAAQVSGIVALLLERNPSLTPDNVRNILMATARHLGPKPKDDDFGAGLANAWQAVKAVDVKHPAQASSNPRVAH